MVPLLRGLALSVGYVVLSWMHADLYAQPLAAISAEDSTFLRMVQRKAFDFFWIEANPSNGLIRDRSQSGSPSSIASVGFGLSSICVASDYGWVSRAAAADRVRTTLRTFWNGPQGYAAQGMIGRLGFFYHFLKMDTAVRDWNCELSSIDTALLLAGIIHAQQYFDGTDPVEQEVRALADSIYRRADFERFRNFGTTLNMGWHPETGWLNAWWVGYNEAMILYILGLGSPTHPITPDLWDNWTGGYHFASYYGQTYVVFPPLFGHQYSHCWVDFRGIRDAKMASYGLDYFENSRRATLAQQAYCTANPLGHAAYSDSIWGITACDGPSVLGGYKARGAPPAENDDGTLAPTAAGGSIAFTPEASLRALKTMYRQYCAGPETRLWGPYGFRDAFNPKLDWFDLDYIGIDQGPIVLMIENLFTQKVWSTFMSSPYIQTGLQRAGFTPVTNAHDEGAVPERFRLEQNYPNPFNPQTTVRFELSEAADVRLEVFDLLGRSIRTMDLGRRNPGSHLEFLNGADMTSGVYLYRLIAGRYQATRTMVLAR
jgi:hypothetical protein